MGAPKTKYFGNLSLDGIKKAVVEIPAKKTEYKGEQQLKVNAAMWDDGNISLSIWNAEKKEEIKLGNLRVSTLDNAQSTAATLGSADLTPKDDDLPF